MTGPQRPVPGRRMLAIWALILATGLTSTAWSLAIRYHRWWWALAFTIALILVSAAFWRRMREIP